MTTTSDSASLGWVNIPVMVLNEETNQQEHALECVRYDQFVLALLKPQTRKEMIFHAALGVCGEAGELADAIKREHVYGKPEDRKNIVEELGDLRWYIQAVMNLYGISEQEILQENAFKLAERYKSLKYSDKAALDRADKKGS